LDPIFGLVAANMLTCRTLRRELPPPSKLTDDELRRITAPTTVVIGDREVIYGGGPEAALERAQGCIRDVQTRLLPGAGHALTVDCPDALVAELMSALD
jgi:pimeloyl-ACP methyl ester carboxylesterase